MSSKVEGVNENDELNISAESKDDADEKSKNNKGENPRKKADFTEGPFLKKMILFAIPLILTGFLQSFYSAADLIVVNLFSQSDAPLVGAIGCTSALTNLVLGMFMGLSVGA
jgi:Na+-driven multidrug efflux pump